MKTTPEPWGIDFSSYIAQRASGFSGRQWVLEAVDGWLDQTSAPHLLLTGEPGSGKSSVAARLCQLSDGVVAAGAGLTRLGVNFIHARHFCDRRDSLWIQPNAFTQSIAVQLAARVPGYAEALLQQATDRRIHLSVEQHLGTIVDGQVVGIKISRLDVGTIPPDEAFNTTVRIPLETALKARPGLRVIIMVDGLDAAVAPDGQVGIVEFVTRTQHLSAGIRFILTSRPENELLRRWRLLESPPVELSLSSGAGLANGLADVEQHVLDAVRDRADLAARLPSDMTPLSFAAAVRERSAGNFLLVHYLLDMLATGTEPITLDQVARLPDKLTSLYIELLGWIAAGQGEHWPSALAILGVLAVAREPLDEQQLQRITGLARIDVRKALTVLRQVLEVDDLLPATQRKYALYHASVAEFLLDADAAELFLCEPIEQHRLIVRSYRGQAASWDEVDWRTVDDYGLAHLAWHLYRASVSEGSVRPDPATAPRDGVYGLICRSFMREKLRRNGSHGAFAADVAIALRATAEERPTNLVEGFRACAVMDALSGIASRISAYTLATLVVLDHAEQAEAWAALGTDAWRQARVYTLLSRALYDVGRRDDGRRMLVHAADAASATSLQLMIGVIESLLSAGEPGQALELTNRIASRVTASGDPHVLAQVAVALARCGVTEQANRLARTALECPTVELIKPRAMAWLWKAGAISRGLLVEVASVDDGFWRWLALVSITESLALTGSTGDAVSVALSIVEPYWQVQALIRIAHATLERDGTAARSAIELAEARVEAVNDRGWQAVALSHIARLLRRSEPARAAALADASLQAAQQLAEGDWRSVATNAAASALAETGRAERALELVAGGLDPDALTSILVAAAPTAVEANRLEPLLEIARVRGGYEPDLLGIAAWSLARAGDRSTAAQFVERALAAALGAWNVNLDVRASRAVAEALLDQSQRDYAREVAARAVELARRAPHGGDAVSLTTLAPLLARLDQWELALEIVTEYGDPGTKARTLYRIAEAVGLNAEPERIKQLVDVARGLAPVHFRLNALAGIVRFGPPVAYPGAVVEDLAADVVVVAAELAGGDAPRRSWLEGSMLDQCEALGNAAPALARVGRPAQALESAIGIPFPHTRMRALCETALLLDDAAHPTELEVIARHADQTWVAMANLREQADGLRYYTRLLAHLGRAAQARGLANLIVQRAFTNPNADQILRIALPVLADQGDIDPAVTAATRVHDASARSAALLGVAYALGRAGQWKMVDSVLRSVFERAEAGRYWDVSSMLADSAALVGQIDQGATLWNVYTTLIELDGWGNNN